MTNSIHSLSRSAAFACCNSITREHSKAFFLATAFLPRDKRDAIRALYAFCRRTDDLVDMRADAERPMRLAQWRESARLGWRDQSDPVLIAWTWVRDHYGVPQIYAEELIDGCEADLTISRYQTWDELQRYCYLVASTVGIMSMYIIGVNEKGERAETFETAKRHAIDLGVALQLTNILRDVGEDLQRGRVYLPQEDLLRFGYPEGDLRAHVINDRFRKLIRFEMDRADALYDSSWQGIGLLKKDGQLAVGAASLLYRAILGKIHANHYNVFTMRAHLTARQKLAKLPSIYVRVRKLDHQPRHGAAMSSH